jgi:hypothetical protein
MRTRAKRMENAAIFEFTEEVSVPTLLDPEWYLAGEGAHSGRTIER